tara:strand:- start:9775 stop:10137 length:363 start_codon:yes stop_codon:yes gene_type:complete
MELTFYSWLKTGDIVRLSMEKIHDGFSTFSRSGEKFILYETVNLTTYPSCKDFLGERVKVQEGDTAAVIRFIGRPEKIRPGPAWSRYDVYEIMIHGKICHAFRQNIVHDKKYVYNKESAP